MTSITSIDSLLIDTWWFGVTSRLSEEAFIALAKQRKSEGFDAIQLVVGIPPEVAPLHPAAASEAGPAWTLKKPTGVTINEAYIDLAITRVTQLNQAGLTAIIYGGWGMQIDWTGVPFMLRWWEKLIKAFDGLDVIYCVTGEVDLWTSMPNILLPDKSTDDLRGPRPGKKHSLRRVAEKIAAKAFRLKARIFNPDVETKRKERWGEVLRHMSELTERPIIVHPGGRPGTFSTELIQHADLLAAITVQTGHSQAVRNSIWELPIQLISGPDDRFINLEPWYEGIREDFWTEDQLFAYWCSVLAGACSHAYGAHGIWNVGDGQFLAHWGKQSFDEAIALKTPALLGQSHAFWKRTQGFAPEARTTVESHEGRLLAISRENNQGRLSYIPNIQDHDVPTLNQKIILFDPLKGQECAEPPPSGPVVIWEVTDNP